MVWCSEWNDCDFCAKFGNNLLNISKVVGRRTKCPRFLAYPVGLSGNETNKLHCLLTVSYFTRSLADESGFDHGDKWENSRLYCFTAKNCTKFVHLIIMKIIRIVATRCQILKLKCIKFYFGLPPPQEPHPRSRPFGPRISALRASPIPSVHGNFSHLLAPATNVTDRRTGEVVVAVPRSAKRRMVTKSSSSNILQRKLKRTSRWQRYNGLLISRCNGNSA